MCFTYVESWKLFFYTSARLPDRTVCKSDDVVVVVVSRKNRYAVRLLLLLARKEVDSARERERKGESEGGWEDAGRERRE